MPKKLYVIAIALFLAVALIGSVSAQLVYSISMMGEGASDAASSDSLRLCNASVSVLYDSSLSITKASQFSYAKSAIIGVSGVSLATNLSSRAGAGIIAGSAYIENIGVGNRLTNDTKCHVVVSGIAADSRDEMNVAASTQIAPFSLRHAYLIEGTRGGAKSGVGVGNAISKSVVKANKYALSASVEWSVPVPKPEAAPVPETGLSHLCVWQDVEPLPPIFSIEQP